jgi:hypothetical protein
MHSGIATKARDLRFSLSLRDAVQIGIDDKCFRVKQRVMSGVRQAILSSITTTAKMEAVCSSETFVHSKIYGVTF